ncbi:hypothetical protein C487_04078 [Natrinema pallidum DSM 3751]|uniref:Uncharacterized protein n=1 Tax=Natrinema pallidum DSM 3751 TaxID=1227495 RepID=L9Z5Q6_9EURY|nr:hypothetical protein [Natrinema pallidum]ELY80503.1 hypothetical protein C487_04078 [Natrinema pallidum DSM 3751]
MTTAAAGCTTLPGTDDRAAGSDSDGDESDSSDTGQSDADGTITDWPTPQYDAANTGTAGTGVGPRNTATLRGSHTAEDRIGAEPAIADGVATPAVGTAASTRSRLPTGTSSGPSTPAVASRRHRPSSTRRSSSATVLVPWPRSTRPAASPRGRSNSPHRFERVP